MILELVLAAVGAIHEGPVAELALIRPLTCEWEISIAIRLH